MTGEEIELRLAGHIPQRDPSEADPIAEMAKQSARTIVNEETAYLDGRSNGPKPGDFGEFPEIPEEAVGAQVMVVAAKDIKGAD